MNLIEHLEHVIGLVERSASQAEIKGALLAIQEEVAGTQQAAAKNVALVEENAKLRKTIDQFVAASKLKRPKIGGPQAPNIM